MIRIVPDQTYQGVVRHDATELRGKTLIDRAMAMKRKGWGWEDIFVGLRQLGMTQEEAREVVFGKRK